ncbi:hypothetical protein F4780DRAFT_747619 [Xylariomycetidae sp. FL0641]|nr:hypothetical protein F4780DRAFT_747619 [Xylariomycetidae sp. FL0641]
MEARAEDIAIVGTACRFPGAATSPAKLWRLLHDPQDLAVPISEDRFKLDGFYHDQAAYHGHSNVKQANLLSENGVHRRFDAAFFGINPVEANAIDPQARHLLETVYEAIEAAGLPLDQIRGSNTAMYAGQMVADYEQITARDMDLMGTYQATGISRALLSNRVSYFFDWHGPSVTIDTACSSSLVAVHYAIQQLRSGQSRVAVAAGANLIFDPHCFIAESTLHMLSSDGKSKMWDASADGYGRGEGIAAIVLKTVSAAQADGDHIECVIRETGLNQDGKTQGITVPSRKAQADLIRDCYARAGLDLANRADRPQYFEAHGTGTPAGDPVEAAAIHDAFFTVSQPKEFDSLCVGSIKTVIGHTEGTAGLAGIIKASLALQHAVVPANLHFNKLNPAIEPFYAGLHVPIDHQPWPLQGGSGRSQRRASVNSFGFGGSNAHAILESYDGDGQQELQEAMPNFAPFIFSAVSEASLRLCMSNFRDHLRELPDATCLRDMAYTLYARRSLLSARACVAASSIQDICAVIDRKLEGPEGLGIISQQKDSEASGPRLLGVFTGQGAQWPGMASDLVDTSPAARKVLADLEEALLSLPEADRPAWSLIQELEHCKSTSNVNNAAFSQPLCTALQILLVHVVRASGVEFAAVVGHSSGEIAAAYAAGMISAHEAIRIAFYRGLHSHLARGRRGQDGAMLAVGTTPADAQELCDVPEFCGRVSIAATNSATSITISGDRDAIEEIEVIFQDEGKFTRMLKVDKAYHSHHMSACSHAYLGSLESMSVQPTCAGDERPLWISSVLGGTATPDMHSLRASYWVANLVQPVLFEQAIESAQALVGPFDVVVEIGPHPALKAPVTQTLQNAQVNPVLYTGLLQRGKSAIVTIADAFGHILARHGRQAVNLLRYDVFMNGESPSPTLVKGLPTYAWDHTNEYWHESRYARATRMRPGPVNELLGHITPDSSDTQVRWRQVLKPSEIPWLAHHRLQQQIVFPAAGYVMLAATAAMGLCRGRSCQFVEVMDVDISRALSFNHEGSSAEIILSLTHNTPSTIGHNTVEAEFELCAATEKDERLERIARGRVAVTPGESSDAVRSYRPMRHPNMLMVEPGQFYKSVEELGYQYTGPFAALDGLQRKMGFASGCILNLEESELVLHPAILDTAFQSVLLAYSAPGDGGLWSLHVPRRIRSVLLDTRGCAHELGTGVAALPFETVLQPEGERDSGAGVCGDIDVYPADGSENANALVQIRGLECVPLSHATEANDKELLSTVTWAVALPDAGEAAAHYHAWDAKGMSRTIDAGEIAALLERMAGFYLRLLDRDVAPEHPARSKGPYVRLLKFASYSISLSRAGQSPLWQHEWEDDTPEVIEEECKALAEVVDIRLMQAIGQNIVAIATEAKSALEVTMRDGLLAEYYSRAMELDYYNSTVARTVQQIVNRLPKSHIIEVGAGTGACTQAILREIGPRFASYTYTDIAPALFDPERFAWARAYASRIEFQTLDITQDPGSQSFRPHSYDVVVASQVLHATPSLEKTLRNVRRLLRPGGYLVVFEILPAVVSYYGVMFGAFPGWWVGAGEGRRLWPSASLSEWHRLLQATGFSGCDSVAPWLDEIRLPGAVFVSQSMDADVALLRDPFLSVNPAGDLILVGGQGALCSRLEGELSHLLAPHYTRIRQVKTLTGFPAGVPSGSTILSLVDLEGEALFSRIDHNQWQTLRRVLLEAEVLIWVTSGRRAERPHANMTVGLVRSAARELPSLDPLFLDFDDGCQIDALPIANAVLERKVARSMHKRGCLHTTMETEQVLRKDGRTCIPRLTPNRHMNDRYNSSRRRVAVAQCHCRNVEITSTPTTLAFATEQSYPVGGSVTVSHSLAAATRVSRASHLFLSLGIPRHASDSQLVVSLSTKQSYIAQPWSDATVPISCVPKHPARLLNTISHYLSIWTILDGLHPGDRILVHEPDPDFASLLCHEAALANIDVTLTTASRHAVPQTARWKMLSPNATGRQLSRLALHEVATFVNLSCSSVRGCVVNAIRSYLPPCCTYEDWTTLAGAEARIPRNFPPILIKTRLKMAVDQAHKNLTVQFTVEDDTRMVPVGNLVEMNEKPKPGLVLDWDMNERVLAYARPADTEVWFSDDKTYWLVGLTGGLGASLCEWMYHRGAKHIVLSSRKPAVDDAWLANMRTLGANIRVSSSDITSEESTRGLFDDICATMLPIGGVVQGAMVLQDTSIQEMTLDDLLKVTEPKVRGSLILEAIFHSKPLDFFIFLSSATAVIGNPGQSNYSAANAFMSSLAEKRRRSGLSASVVHIGPVLGVGYIAEARARHGRNPFLKATERSGSYIMTSERDFHQLFAESVLACRNTDTESVDTEILTGLGPVDDADEPSSVWASEPLMSHFIRHNHSHSLIKAHPNSSVSVKTHLTQAKSLEQVAEIVRDAFRAKMATLFQLDPDKSDMASIRFDQLGIDSLSAVEIRTWFSRTLEVNVPVLRILNGLTVGELVSQAAAKIYQRLAPEDNHSISVHDVADGTESSIDESNNSIIFGDETTLLRSDQSQATSLDDEPPPRRNVTPSDNHVQRVAKLSLSQEMYWFVDSFSRDKMTLNHTGTIRLTGSVRIRQLRDAVRRVGQAHESLRTCFLEQDGVPQQVVLGQSTLDLECRQITSEKEVHAAHESSHQRVFDLSSGDVMYLMLLSISPTEHFLVFTVHNLALDGMSFQVFLNDLLHYYNSPHANRSPAQFLDYADKQNVSLAAGRYRRELRFWKQELAPMPPPLPILRTSPARIRPKLPAPRNARTMMRISPQTRLQVLDLCRRFSTTAFHFYLAIFRALLSRYADDAQDIAIGIADAGRRDEETLDMIGPLVNLLPVRLHAESTTHFYDLLQQTREKTLSALENSALPFQVLLRELSILRSASHPPLFQCFVDYRQGQRIKSRWGDHELQFIAFDNMKAGYDVFLDIVDDPVGDSIMVLEARCDLYGKDEVDQLARSYERLLAAFIQAPEARLQDPDMFSPLETEPAMCLSQGPPHSSFWPETVLHRFHDLAGHIQDKIAVCWDHEQSVSYKWLSLRTYAIARGLQEAGVLPGAAVAVLQQPTGNWIASILAIMHTGAMYVPLDVGLPWARLRSIATDCDQIRVVLVDDCTADKPIETLAPRGLHSLDVSTIPDLPSIEAPLSSLAPVHATAEGVAAIMYTSGSTGKPKGVMLQHRGLKNFMEPTRELYPLGVPKVLQQTACCFDMSLSQILLALCHGGSLYLVPTEQRGDALAVGSVMAREGVTTTLATPSEYSSWITYGRPGFSPSPSLWRLAFCGGEILPESVVEQFRSLNNPDLELFNHYGPTETCFAATSMRVPVQRETEITAGRPLPNYSVYVVDALLRPVPIGMQGEIAIGGPGVGLGYWDNPELTAQRFTRASWAGGLLHRTGDTGRWTQHGTLLVEGRVGGDTQIKLRGLRIDLNDVERALYKAGQGALRELVVTARHNSYLVAHVVLDDASIQETPSGLTQKILPRLDALPLYMRPVALMPTEELPKTWAGKLDRKAAAALPLPAEDPRTLELGGGVSADLSPTMLRLRDIWHEVLPEQLTAFTREPLATAAAITTDFFQVGGTSLLLLRLRSRITQDFGIELPLISLFERSTLDGMAFLIDTWQGGGNRQLTDLAGYEVDWDAETALPPSILRLPPTPTAPHPGILILTGATGLLGRTLLALLDASPKVQKIHCIGVRKAHSRRTITDSAKVMFHDGDLTLPRLGLSDETAEQLFSEAQSIIHNAADKSYLKTYSSLRACNLESTKELAKMAAPYSVPIHYISTASVSDLVDKNEKIGLALSPTPGEEASPIPANPRIAQGYIASKWASEKFLERLTISYPQWPVWIHRPTLVLGNNGHCKSPGPELIDNLRYYAVKLHAVPSIASDKLKKTMNVVDVDSVALGIYQAVMEHEVGTEAARGPSRLHFLSHAGDVEVSLEGPEKWLIGSERPDEGSDEDRRGGVRLLGLSEWATEAGEIGMDSSLVEILRTFEHMLVV